MRAVCVASLALIALACLTAGAGAQNLDPRSTTNVLPTADSAATASIEARRRALFARMLANPADLDVAFEYAALSAQAGDLEGAISTLERMLIFAPGLPRLQFELGVLYFRLGSYVTAATYLEAVAADPAVPADVQANVALYLAAIEEQQRGTYFAGSITAGLRYQSNANSGVATQSITLGGLNFLLNPGALGTPDTNAFVAGSFRASIDLESQGDRFDVLVEGYGALYRTMATLNTGIIEARIGPTVNLQRFSIDGATLGLYGIAGGGLLGGAPYLGTLGLGSALTFVLDARSRVVLRGEARYEAFYDSAARPTASQRSGWHWSAAATWDHKLSPDLGIFATLSADRRSATRGYLSTTLLGARAGLAYKFASPIEMLEKPWTFAVSAGVERQVADAPDPTYSATTPETVTRAFTEGTLTVPLENGFSVRTTAGYSQSFSNYPLGSFGNFSASAAVGKEF